MGLPAKWITRTSRSLTVEVTHQRCNTYLLQRLTKPYKVERIARRVTVSQRPFRVPRGWPSSDTICADEQAVIDGYPRYGGESVDTQPVSKQRICSRWQNAVGAGGFMFTAIGLTVGSVDGAVQHTAGIPL